MPVPKRKVSKSRRDKRQANKGIKAQAFTTCDNCIDPRTGGKTPIMPHAACHICGFYKGRKIFTTKLDRSVQRKETRQQKAAAAEKQAPAEAPQEPANK